MSIRKVIFTIATLYASLLPAQTLEKGILKGRVFNAKNNQAVAFATVAIWGTSTGTLSDEQGNFKISGIKPGYIELKVSCIGFEPYVSSQVLVTNANSVFLDIPLVESAVEIDAVVVKTSTFRRDEESPVSLRNIGIQEIEKNPGGNRDISKVLQSFPGVASTPSFRNDVIVRGGGSSENRFYLDGVEIPNLNHFATQGASGGPVGIINVDFLREVHFYSGAFPANTGDALSSVLDFKQINGNREKLKARASVGASDIALTLDGPISDSSTFIFSVRRSYLQFLFSAIGLPFLPTYNDFQCKTKTMLNARNEISFIGLGAIDQFKLNLDANKTEAQRYILSYLPVNTQWNYTLGMVYKHFGERSYDTWVVSRNMLNNTQYKDSANIALPGNRLLDYNSYEAENKVRYERTTQRNVSTTISWGANAGYDSYYNSTFRKAYGGADTYTTNLSFFRYGFFSQTSKKFFDKKAVVSIGIRADGATYSEKTLNPLRQFSPRVSFSYALRSNFYFNCNTGRYYQLPPYTALGFRDGAGNLANKNALTYILADHFVAGFDYQPNMDAKISVEGFVKLYQHYPFSVKDSVALASKGADFGTYGDEKLTASGVGRAYGAEFLYQNKDFFGTSVTLSYTLVRSEFKDNAGKYVASSWDNKHLLNLLLRREFRGNWDIGLKWRFVGGAPYTPVDQQTSSLVEAWNAKNQAYLDYAHFNQQRLKSFHQLDIRIDKEFFFNKWSLITYVDIQNVYNNKADAAPIYIVDQTKPLLHNPERYALKKLENTGGGTVLPTVGIIFQF